MPKALRDTIGVDEGNEVILEARDGIVIRPVKKRVDADRICLLLGNTGRD